MKYYLNCIWKICKWKNVYNIDQILKDNDAIWELKFILIRYQDLFQNTN